MVVAVVSVAVAVVVVVVAVVVVVVVAVVIVVVVVVVAVAVVEVEVEVVVVVVVAVAVLVVPQLSSFPPSFLPSSPSLHMLSRRKIKEKNMFFRRKTKENHAKSIQNVKLRKSKKKKTPTNRPSEPQWLRSAKKGVRDHQLLQGGYAIPSNFSDASLTLLLQRAARQAEPN